MGIAISSINNYSNGLNDGFHLKPGRYFWSLHLHWWLCCFRTSYLL